MQLDLNDEKELTLQIINANLNVNSHLDLLHWLQGDIQQFLPHNILISAWGDFSLGLIYLDVVALHPLLRTSNISKALLKPKILELFNLWLSHNSKPLQMNIEDNYLNIIESIKSDAISSEASNQKISKMNTAIVHGIKDTRGSYDCLYILMSEANIPSSAKLKLAVFMPFIDCAFRRIEQLPEVNPAKNLPDENNGEDIRPCLSSRECEIMDLIQEGNSNEEVGMTLDISIFTVKNHLQRIYRKLGAINRSQAAFKYKAKFQK